MDDLDLSGVFLESSGDEHPEVKDVFPSPSKSLALDTSNQSLFTEDVHELFRKQLFIVS